MPSDARVASTVANDNSIGVAAWTGLTNIASSNNVDATVTNSPGDISQYLKQTNYPFSIPAGSIILGIEVYIEHRANGNGSTEDYAVYLVKGGVISGNNKAVAGSWPGSDTGRTYGGPTDLWGLTLTRADVLASDFGCVIATQETEDKSDNDTARIDVSTIRVYYTPGLATVSPVSTTLTVVTQTATFRANATVSPLSINISVPSLTATYEVIFQATVSPFELNILIPAVTATYSEDEEEEVIEPIIRPSHKKVMVHDELIYIVSSKDVGWGVTKSGKVKIILGVGGRMLDNLVERMKRGVHIDNIKK